VKRTSGSQFGSFTMKAITIALAITLVGFATTGVLIWKSYQGYKRTLSRDYRFQFLINSLNSGPSMTSIAREAATKGKLDEEEVYRYLAADVNSAIEEIKKLAPDQQVRDTAEKLDAANTRLVEMENRAFDLVREGRYNEARLLVYGEEYKDNIDIFDECNYSLSEILKTKVEKEVASLRKLAFISFAVIAISIPVLIFVWIVTIGLVKKRLRERTRQEDINVILASLGKKLSAVSTPKEAALVILDAADELFGWDACYVVTYSHQLDRFYSVVSFDVIEGERREIPVPFEEKGRSFFMRSVLSEGARLFLRKSVDEEPSQPIIPFGDTSHYSRSLMFVPIRKGEINVGILSIQSYTPDLYNNADLELFQVLADHCSGALDRTIAEEKLQKAHDELEKRVQERTRELSQSNILLKQEVVERKKAEEELAQSVSLYRATLESTTDGILVADKKGGFVNCNRKFIRMWSIPSEVLEKQEYYKIERFITERLIAPLQFSKRIQELSRDTDVESFDILELKNEMIFECYSKPQLLGEKCVGRVWSFRDVTERRKAEQALERSEAIYREAIENASGVPYRFIYGEDIYGFVGKEIKTLTGFSPEQFNFKHLNNMIREIIILDPDAPKDHEQYVEAFKQGNVDQYRVDLRLVTPAGEEKWVSDCSVPIHDEKTGKVIGSLGILQDITKRKQVEEQARIQQEQLIQTDKMVSLGILVSGVAHEINNPNNFIMLNTPLLLEAWESILPILNDYYQQQGDFVVGGLQYSEMREHVPVLFSGIVDGAKRIKNIVQELRDFARQHPGELMEDIDINAVVHSALTLVSNMIKKTTDRFDVKYGSALPKLRGNFQRLEQVVINLIQNACYALPDKNRGIFVSTSYDIASSVLQVIVQDEGKGIPPDMMKHIMDPFFTTKRDEGGSGLGLSISNNIINEHGGRLIIASKEGEGTTARVVLPLNKISEDS